MAPEGITLEGFKQFIVEEVASRRNKWDFLEEWLKNLGYDDQLY